MIQSEIHTVSFWSYNRKVIPTYKSINKRQRIPKGKSTKGKEDEEKTQYVLDTTTHKQTQIT